MSGSQKNEFINRLLSKKPEIVRYLLGKGANRDAKDNEGKTPADWARSAGSPEVEALLTETGKR
jgi:ankyrin repeat protein